MQPAAACRFSCRQLHRHAHAVDLPHRADHAIGETGVSGAFAPGITRELHAVAGGEHLRPVFGLQDVVLAEIAPLLAQRADVAVEGVHVRIGFCTRLRRRVDLLPTFFGRRAAPDQNVRAEISAVRPNYRSAFDAYLREDH
jgi:hypothetical protein